MNTPVDSVTGVTDFCGDFAYKVTRKGSDTWSDMREFAVQCGIDTSFTSDAGTDCQETVDVDKLMTYYPEESWQEGDLEFTVYVTFDRFLYVINPPSLDDVDFIITTETCETSFAPITESPFPIEDNPYLIVIGMDSYTEIDVPEFEILESRCHYKRYVDAWTIDEDDGSVHGLPDNIDFYFESEQ